MDEQSVTAIVESVIKKNMDSLAETITNAVTMQISTLVQNKTSNKEPGVNINGAPEANGSGASTSVSPEASVSTETRSEDLLRSMSDSSDDEDFVLKVSRGNSPVSTNSHSSSSSSTSSKSVKVKSDLPKYWKSEKPPKFHESEISPPLYLENLKLYFKRQNVYSDESKINCAIDGMRGQAEHWAEFSRPTMHTYKDFKTSFLKKFWSEEDKLAYKELIFSETFRSVKKDEKLSKFFDRNYAKARRYFPEMSFHEMRKRFANQLPSTMAYSILQSRAKNVEEMQEILKVTEQYKPKDNKYSNDLNKNSHNKNSSTAGLSNYKNYQSKTNNYKSDRGSFRHHPYNNTNRNYYNNGKSNSATDNRNKNWSNNNSKFERRVNVLQGEYGSRDSDFSPPQNNYSRSTYGGRQNSNFRGRGSSSRGRGNGVMSRFQTERMLDKKLNQFSNKMNNSMRDILLVQKAAATVTNIKEENSPAAAMGGTHNAAAAHSKQCYHQGN